MAIAFFDYTHYDSVARFVGIEAGTRSARVMTLATAITADRLVPVRSGRLRASQRSRVRRVGLTARGTIWYPLDYAMSQHDGSRRHIIRARKPGGMLVFMHHGRLRVTPQVNHPGTRPDPWLFTALAINAARNDYRVTRLT